MQPHILLFGVDILFPFLSFVLAFTDPTCVDLFFAMFTSL